MKFSATLAGLLLTASFALAAPVANGGDKGCQPWDKYCQKPPPCQNPFGCDNNGGHNGGGHGGCDPRDPHCHNDGWPFPPDPKPKPPKHPKPPKKPCNKYDPKCHN